jgi:hypothetical protein
MTLSGMCGTVFLEAALVGSAAFEVGDVGWVVDGWELWDGRRRRRWGIV